MTKESGSLCVWGNRSVPSPPLGQNDTTADISTLLYLLQVCDAKIIYRILGEEVSGTCIKIAKWCLQDKKKQYALGNIKTVKENNSIWPGPVRKS